MKTTHITRFSLFVLVAFLSQVILAQSTKTYKESFDVNDDAIVKLAVSNSKIKIETWNKNRVEVKTILKTKNDSEQDLDALFGAWKISALGNSERVEIKDHRSGDNVMVFSNVQRPHLPPRPPRPPRPTKANQPLNPPEIDFDFDYEAFKEDGKAYIEKFKKQLDSSDFRNKIQIWSEAYRDSLGMHRDSLQKYRLELREHRETIRGYAKQMKEEMAPLIEKLEERIKTEVLQHPNFNNVERIIEIKIPKSAKLEVDIKHSEMDISSVYEIDANLNYSGLQISSLSGNHNMINARYSKIDIENAESLNLSLAYSKNAKLGKVKRLVLNSKTSNLNILEIEDQAIIDGSFGNLTIDKVNPDFNLIDINLKNSNAKLKLPEVNYNFYMNSKSSKLNLKSELDFKIRKGYDTTIYQNSELSNSKKALNINADFSVITLN
ncbi:hypothetical protein [Psychroflexus aestuariivivens]|uniref:hypothetical protein n=1 Tax=Psychroflexus aestuariivivens TaxID=1795040 RepID=UPI000FD97360|nr:hypothetical protein [Psychroflexus aestuariivivens]